MFIQLIIFLEGTKKVKFPDPPKVLSIIGNIQQ